MESNNGVPTGERSDPSPTGSTFSIPGLEIKEDQIDFLLEKSLNVTQLVQEAMTSSLGATESTLETYKEVNNPDIMDFGAGVGVVLGKVKTFCARTNAFRRHREQTQTQVLEMMMVGLILLVAVIGWGVIRYYHH